MGRSSYRFGRHEHPAVGLGRREIAVAVDVPRTAGGVLLGRGCHSGVMTHQLHQTDVASLPAELPEGLAVLDVREPDEWAAGHIAGAIHVPLVQIPQRAPELPAGRQVLVVCRVGSRSAQATAFLQQRGIDAVNLADGMVGWMRAGRPMVAESDHAPLVL